MEIEEGFVLGESCRHAGVTASVGIVYEAIDTARGQRSSREIIMGDMNTKVAK